MTERDQLIERIAAAFSGVALGDGIGLQEAQELDHCRDEETCAAARAADEKNDWRLITAEDLNRCESSLSYFNAEGMRFHLPGYMTAELLGDYYMGAVSNLTHLDAHGRSYFAALNAAQRLVVREFLQFVREDLEYESDVRNIDRALTEFWTDSDDATDTDQNS